MIAGLQTTLRQLGVVVAAGAAASLAVGAALGLWQGESVLRWGAYMLYVAGALLVGYAFIAGAPPSGRSRARRELLKREEERGPRPLATDLVVLVAAGLTLVLAGVLIELAL